MAPLEGLRVIDLTRYLSGPTLTMLLADLGAEVIKVETLPHGDPARQSGPFHGTESVYYLASNRNKRSIAVDLRMADGRDIVYRLVERADVFVENFRPGTAVAMGFGAEELHRRNPGLVYASISGFGATGPGASLPGFDQTAQAMSGLMSVTGTEQTGPMRVGIAVSDSATGVFAAVGVLAALAERNRTGRGSVVDSSLMQSTLTLMSYQAQKYLSLGEIPGLVGNDHPIMFPQGTFLAADGAVTLASGNEKMWHRLCAALGIADLASDPRFHDNAARMANRVELRAILEGVLKAKPAAEWVEIINAAGIPCGPVLDVEQALTHPISDELQMVQRVHHPTLSDLKVLGPAITVTSCTPAADETEGWLRYHPPLMGEQSVEILREAGYAPERIDELVASNVVAGRVGSDAD